MNFRRIPTPIRRLIQHERLAFILTLTVGILLMVALGRQKSNVTFHIDEIFQYSFANSYGKGTNVIEKEDLNKWLSPAVFRDYVTVQPDEKFSFKQVMEGSKYDIHPPLSEFLLNAVCSLRPNHFSKWFGLALNIVIYALTFLFLYLISKLILGSPPKALGATAFWAFSLGAVDTVMYIRMYCLLTLFAVAAAYFALKYITTKRTVYLLPLFAAFVLGGLTEYIFWIFGFFVTVAVFFLNCRRYIWKSLFFGATTFLSFVVTTVLFPATVLRFFDQTSVTRNVMRSMEGQSPLDKFFHVGDVLKRFVQFASEEVLYIWPGAFWYLVYAAVAATLLFLLVMFTILATKNIPQTREGLNPTTSEQADPTALYDHLAASIPGVVHTFFRLLTAIAARLWRCAVSRKDITFLVIVAGLTAYTLAAIFPDYDLWTVRAFFFIYPFFSILAFALLAMICQKLKIHPVALILVICLALLRTYTVVSSPFLFPGAFDKISKRVKNKNVIVVLFSDESLHRLANFCTVFPGAKQIFVTDLAGGTYREAVSQALATVGNDAEIAAISLYGSPRENEAALKLLGPEYLLTDDSAFKAELGKHGYEIRVTNRVKQIFQWFNFYEVVPATQPGDQPQQ